MSKTSSQTEEAFMVKQYKHWHTHSYYIRHQSQITTNHRPPANNHKPLANNHKIPQTNNYKLPANKHYLPANYHKRPPLYINRISAPASYKQHFYFEKHTLQCQLFVDIVFTIFFYKLKIKLQIVNKSKLSIS